ncbi:MAG: hypothetical protein C0599_04045 [Salinivirgaceae bacterium]|nr:MAG: hypothetical protein C0599_04045 [Salinivirgaceae bacterium]
MVNPNISIVKLKSVKMRNRILSFLLVFCAFTISVNAQQYGKIVDYFDSKVVMNQEKQDLNMKAFIPFKSNEAKASKVTFISESFDTEIPDTWTVINTGAGTYPGWLWADVWAGNGIPLTGFAVIDSDENGSGNATAGELITPAFDCASAAGLKLEFDARYNDLTADGGDFFAVDVWDGTAWVNVATWDEDHGTDDVAEKVTIDITAYVSDSCLVRFVYDDAGSWAWYAGIDNVVIFEPDPTNLRALDLMGSPFATEGQEKTFSFVFENIGTEAVPGADYTLNIVDTAGNVLSTVSGVDIDPATIDTVSIAYTPAVADTIAIYGMIDYANDSDDADNETEVMELYIMAEGNYVGQVGEDETFPPSRVPFDFYYKNSASQTIYTPDQLGIGGGVLQALAYENNFNTDLSGGKPVKIWIGETTESDLSNGWIDPSTLTLVFDDTIVLPAGANIIPITLTTPYVYTGGNLVIYTYRVWEDEYYSSSDKFYGSEFPESNCTRRNSSDTEFPDDLSTVEGSVISWVPNTTLFFSTEGLGALSGTITNTGVPIEGVSVKVVDGFASTMTDAAGEYMFPYLLAGDYELALSKFGFEPDTITGITVIEADTVVADGTIDSIPTFAVTGTITSSDLGTGIEGAAVTLEGYEMYLDSTDASGVFLIEGVYGGTRDYVMTVSFPGYETFKDTITVIDADLTAVDVVLEEIPYPALGVNAMINESDEALVTWLAPGSLIPAEFRYDNGIQTGQLGSSSGTDNTVLGSVHRVNAQLMEVSWMTTAEGGPHATVNVFIFDLDENGAPTNNVLYSAMAVENTDMEWTVHTLPEPVDAPNGFMIAMSYAGFAGLGTTDPDEDYPYTDNTHYFSSDYTGGEFATVESLGDPSLEKPFMIRAYGYNMGKSKAQPSFAYGKQGKVNHTLELITNEPYKPEAPIFALPSQNKEFVDYTVYRLVEGDAMGDWVEVGSNVTDTSFVDADWTNQTFGLYQYAVVANYTNGVLSEATLSNVLPKDMTVDYTIGITTNASEDGSGAVVTLTNRDADPEHVYMLTADATGVAFDSVWRGVYDITIEKTGFDLYTADSVVIEEGGLSMDVELIETILEPYGLIVAQEGYNANFSWNNALGFSDSFEDYEDFNYTDFGGYTLVDGDGGSAYGFQGVDFPNTGYVGSYIVFNPSLTTPALTDPEFQPVTGDKYLVCFASQTPPNDDWLITPEVTAANGMEVSFMAKSITADYGLERFYVAVSTTGTDPGDFTVISGASFVEAPVDWTSFSYDLSAYAGQNIYIGIHCVSNDAFMFMIDDLNIGMASKSKAFTGYTVYLDEAIEATDLTAANYTFESLALGTYTAGVKAVYETGESSVVTIDFEIVEPTYSLTFNVMDESTSNLMSGVSIDITDGTDTWNYSTDANGQAVMEMTNGTYTYTVTMEGYDDVTGTVTIADAAETIDIMMAVGINETVIPGFVVYPNPSKGNVTVKADAMGSIVVLDAVGQVILEKEFNGTSTVDMSNNSSGIYFIRLMTDNKVATKRVVIE